MTTLTITPFSNGKRAYTRATAYKAPVTDDTRLQTVMSYIDNSVIQLHLGTGPSGISFAEWKATSNDKANFVQSHGLLLDYARDKEPELAEAARRLDMAHFFMDTENKSKTLNAVTLVIPFAEPLSAAQYERVASCIVSQMGVFGLMDGALAATHIVDIHATTKTRVGHGRLMDAQAYIKRTAKLFQGQDALKYHKAERPMSASVVHLEAPTITSSDGLFEFPMSKAEQAQRQIDRLQRITGLTF